MLVEAMTVAENVLLGQSKGFWLSPSKMLQQVSDLSQHYSLGIDPLARVYDLSMGERQRVEILKLLYRQSRVLIFDEPTRGIDVGSIEFIHNQIVAKRDEGVAVLVVSSELDEIMALADRIVVMYKGEVIGIVPREEATREGLGLLMAGVTDEAVAA